MEMILTGSTISAEKAERDGLVARVCQRDKLMEEVIDMGLIIGSKGQVAVMMAKEAVNAAEQMTLDQGLLFERRLFHSLFATKDQKEVCFFYNLVFILCPKYIPVIKFWSNFRKIELMIWLTFDVPNFDFIFIW